jgi:hypothetical protein
MRLRRRRASYGRAALSLLPGGRGMICTAGAILGWCAPCEARLPCAGGLVGRYFRLMPYDRRGMRRGRVRVYMERGQMHDDPLIATERRGNGKNTSTAACTDCRQRAVGRARLPALCRAGGLSQYRRAARLYLRHAPDGRNVCAAIRGCAPRARGAGEKNFGASRCTVMTC